MGKELLVIATAVGFYGGKLRYPADKEPFAIKNEAELGSWMAPQGWTPKGADKSEAKGEEPKGADKSETSPADGSEPASFRGVKEKYGPNDEVAVTAQEAIAQAITDLGYTVEQWNALSEGDRKSNTMEAVNKMVKDKQAEAAA